MEVDNNDKTRQQYLRDHFLEPETRCGCYISPEKKAIWKVQLDIAETVQDICEKNGVRYWATAGTLLGTARHRGFIPWDEDLDFAMPREDYNRFIATVQKDLPAHLSLETFATDKEYRIPHARICDIRTTCIWETEIRCFKPRYKMGVFVDIFSLDEKPANKAVRKFALFSAGKLMKLIQKANANKLGPCHSLVKSMTCKILAYVFVNLLGRKNVCRMYEWCCGFHGLRGEGIWALNIVEWGYDSRYSWPRELFSETIRLPFEYLEIPVPKNYERMLELTYGDWHKFVKGDSMQSGFIQTASMDYKTVLIERYGYERSELQ